MIRVKLDISLSKDLFACMFVQRVACMYSLLPLRILEIINKISPPQKHQNKIISRQLKNTTEMQGAKAMET